MTKWLKTAMNDSMRAGSLKLPGKLFDKNGESAKYPPGKTFLKYNEYISSDEKTGKKYQRDAEEAELKRFKKNLNASTRPVSQRVRSFHEVKESSLVDDTDTDVRMHMAQLFSPLQPINFNFKNFIYCNVLTF